MLLKQKEVKMTVIWSLQSMTRKDDYKCMIFACYQALLVLYRYCTFCIPIFCRFRRSNYWGLVGFILNVHSSIDLVDVMNDHLSYLVNSLNLQ